MLATIRSEITKTFTLPSVWIMTGVLFAVFLFFQYQIFGFYSETAAGLATDQVSEPVVVSGLLSDLESSIFNPGILLTVLGAIIAGAEFRTGQFGMSVVAVPNRIRLVLGKTIVTALYAVVLGLVWIIIATWIMLASADGVSLGSVFTGDYVLAQLRMLLFLVAFALFPLGLTLITKRTLTGVIVAMVVIMLTMSQIVAMIAPVIDALLPLSAARNLLLQGANNPVPLTGSALNGALVLAAWAIITTVAAAVVIKRRDAR